MSDIRDIVDVQITKGTRTITRQGFGTLMVIVDVTDGVATQGFRVKSYSSVNEVADDWATSDFAYKAATAYFGQTPSPRFLKIGIFDDGVAEADTDYPDAYSKIVAIDADWYAVAAETRVAADVQSLASTVAADEKLYGTSSDDADILDGASTTDIAYLLNNATQERAFVLYSTDQADAPEAAWFGKMLPTDPGSATWAFKNLATISADNLTSSQAVAVFAKGGNTYEPIAGQNITRYGTVATNEYIDVVRGIDWLTARMAEQIYFRLVNSPKIPYTKNGQAIIEADMKTVLEIAVNRGVITAGYTVEMPEISGISAIDRAARYMPDIKFFATLQGAVHTLQIRGTVSV
jgi:major membrane immunogen (membrane-anchored lipoprotein)